MNDQHAREPSQMKTGRPTSCTDEVVQAVVRAVERGLSLRAAAAAAGVSRESLTNWNRRGATGEEPYATFLRLVTRARATAEERMAAVVEQMATSGDVKVSLNAATWWLERRRPERWARRDRPEVTMRAEDPKTLTREQLVERIRVLAVREGILPPDAAVGVLPSAATTDEEEDDE